MKTSAAEWKDERGLRHQGGLQWQGSDTSLKRSLRSCGRSMFSYYRWRREFGGLKSEPGVLELKVLQALHLLTPIWRIASTMFWPCETKPLRVSSVPSNGRKINTGSAIFSSARKSE
jgi:hypothetical protein